MCLVNESPGSETRSCPSKERFNKQGSQHNTGLDVTDKPLFVKIHGISGMIQIVPVEFDLTKKDWFSGKSDPVS